MSGIRTICAVVPVKTTASAKERLSGLVPAHLRPGLALTMFEDVVDALSRVPELSAVAVVTIDAAVGRIAERYGARVIPDGPEPGHTAVVAAAARRLVLEGCDGMLQVPGDIPLVTADEISRLIQAHQASPAFTISPSHDEKGSNAILLSPPDAVSLTFGDDSYFPHLDAARRHGIEPTVVRSPGIARDVDWPEDIVALAQTPARTRTHAFLARHGFLSGGSGTADQAFALRAG